MVTILLPTREAVSSYATNNNMTHTKLSEQRQAYFAIAKYAYEALEREDLTETEAIVAILHYAIDTLMQLEEEICG